MIVDWALKVLIVFGVMWMFICIALFVAILVAN